MFSFINNLNDDLKGSSSNSLNSNLNQNNNNNIYQNSPLSLVNQQETIAAVNSFNNARRPFETGVVAGHGFQQRILNDNNMADPRYHVNNQPKNAVVTSELSGQQVQTESFHDNMVPFIGRGVMQNTNPHANETLLEKFTGAGPGIRKKKMEVKSFFDHAPNMGGHTHGTPAFTSHGFENRFYASRYRQGEKPFQDIKVGPAINAGFGTEGHGGFHQANTQELARARANRVINNRLPNNPRITYSIPLKPGALPGGSRGLQAAVKKNRPETWYRNDPSRYFVTTGPIKASKLREKVNAKATRRQNHKSYYGGIKQSQHLKPKKDPAVRKSHKNNFMNDGQRNLYRSDGWVVDDEANSIAVGDYGKGAIENKANEREVTELRNHRLNLTYNVKKLITPLTDLFRKTRKENFIGNVRPEGNMKAQMPDKLTIHDPEDVARTTRKEQNIHNNHEGFLKGPETNTVWDPEDVARTTIKEQNIHNKAPYMNMKPQQPNSLRVYDPEDIARTTIKEMTEDNNHMGFFESLDYTKPGGYISTNVSMRNTHKQFISDYYYTGHADGDVGKGDGKGYLAASYRAKITDKQFISDYEYTGIAGGYKKRETSYGADYNARLNPNKEIIAQGRAPTQNKEKLGSGGDMVNVQHKKLETDRINIREPSETSVYQAPPQKNSCGMTTIKIKLPEDVQRDRINPDLLSAFKENPYTQSLQSAV
jgi:hypothetical protein